MNKPTKKTIRAEIVHLKTIKPNVLMESMFGDNHHDAIDAQIDVLMNGMTEDNVYDACENDGLKDNVRDAMLEAAQWVNGKSEVGAPSKGWKDLVRK
jgi:hypothetical protein